MTDTKPWWQSETKLGILASSVSVLLGIFGVVVDASTLTQITIGVAALVGNYFANQGRNKATTPIDTKQVLPGLRLK